MTIQINEREFNIEPKKALKTVSVALGGYAGYKIADILACSVRDSIKNPISKTCFWLGTKVYGVALGYAIAHDINKIIDEYLPDQVEFEIKEEETDGGN